MKKVKVSMIIFLVMCVMVICMGSSAQAEKILIANSYRNLTNEYWTHWNNGAINAARSLGCEYLSLSADDSEAKQISDVEGAVIRGVNAIMIMPVSAAALGSMVDLCVDQKIWVISMWDRPWELKPEDYKYWVAHITISSVKQGYYSAKILCETLGGKGKIVAIGGLAGTGSSEDRYEGLKKALKEYPDIELLDYQLADYNLAKAVKVMEDFYSAYGDKIDGVWCANDEMATGALEVLRPLGLAGGKIKVAGVDGIKKGVKGIIDGDRCATVSGEPWYLGGLGIVYAYNAAVAGRILPPGERIVELEPTVIDKSNAAEFYQANFVDEPVVDWKKIAEEVAEKMLPISEVFK